MQRYLLTRLFMIVPLTLIITLIAFILLSLAPSDPAEVVLRVHQIIPTEQAIESMRRELGLNSSLPVRYFRWLANCLTLDFGRSYISKIPVIDEFMTALPATLRLAGAAFLLIILTSLPLGILCALKANSTTDKLLRTITFALTAMPNYWIALLLIWLLAVKLDWLPIGGMQEDYALLLPAITLALGYAGTYIRLIRTAMLHQLQQHYVLYAQARGLPARLIILRHILMNSLLSAITAMGMSIPRLIAGALIIENIFSWPGIGQLCLTAVFNRDLPMIQFYVLFMALLFLLFNLFADMLHFWLDPRLRPEAS